MNSRDRVLRTIQHKETDRVPFGLFGTSSINQSRIVDYFKCSTLEEMYRLIGIDIWYSHGVKYKGKKKYYEGEEADHWGIPASVYKDGDSSMRCPLRNISSVEEVEAYDWPSPDDFDYSGLAIDIEEHSEFAIIGGVWAPIFHNLTWLCGFENTLANLVLEPEISEAVIRHVTDFWVGYTKRTLEVAKGKIDIIENCNDFGTQNGLIMSPEQFRHFFKPALKRLCDTIKEYDVNIMQHSCGSIVTLIPDFIEIGVDILNPVQVNATGMDIEFLAREYGDKVTFYGGIDTQHVLPKGPVDLIRRETRRTIDILGKNGGLILAASQGLEADIPVEHVMAMFEEGKLYNLIKGRKVDHMKYEMTSKELTYVGG